MLDIKWIRENPQALDAALARRGAGPRSGDVLELDTKNRAVITELQGLQTKRNEV
ncbi:MAG: serine--tRNA ligase, partial [Alphaproteobacteria bacterium]|nr:serine--tRNA ligase [Alphaproteobacteria bacterium]